MKTIFALFLSLILTFYSFLSLGQNNILDQQNFLKFIENKQQWEEDFLFKAKIPSGNLFLQKNRLIYSFYDNTTYGKLMADLHDHGATPNHEENEDKIDCHAFSVDFLGSNPNTNVIGENALLEKRNYFYGNKQATDVQAFQKIIYNELFNAIDLHIFQNENSLKYEFHVAPHAKTSHIKLQYNHASSMFISEDGSLHITTSLNRIIEQEPYAYQIIKGKTKKVKCRFYLEDNILSYKLGHYNHNYPLVIDPQLIFSTYSGAQTDNWGNTACLDQRGNLYTGGTVFNDVFNGFPATLGAFQTTFQGGETDIGILKFDSSGTQLLYATYIGGDDSEIPTSLITDDKGELYILATTGSSNFPTSDNAFQKTFQGSSSEGKWLVNGNVVAKNTQTFSSNSLKEGDQVQFVLDHSLCRNHTIDSSKVITISEKPRNITASLEASHKNFCTGDSISFLVSHSNIISVKYEWFINNISIGNDSNIFTSNNLKDNDIIKCKVEDITCNTHVFTNEWKVIDVTGKTLDVEILSNPEIVCSNGQYRFSLSNTEIGYNSDITWKNKERTIGFGYSIIQNTILGDSIYATIDSDLSCLTDTIIFSDTIIINDSEIVPASVNFSSYRLDPFCYNGAFISTESNYIGIGSPYTLFYNGTEILTSFNGDFLISSRSIANNEGFFKVEVDNTLGCVTGLVSDSANLTFSDLLQVSVFPSNTICKGEVISFTNNIEDSNYDFAHSISPVGGYTFTQGTDIAVIKLNSDGDQIIASTLLGGKANDGLLFIESSLNNNYGDILRGDINVDNEGNVYFASVTQSEDFPIVNGIQKQYNGGSSDGIVAKLNPDFSQIVWSSYLGGSNDDALYSIQLDSSNNVYVAGGTLSSDFPIVTGGIQSNYQGDVDAVVSKFNSTGTQLISSTFWGTAQYDQAYFIQLDDDNDIYILGQSKGNIPVLPDSSVYHQINAGLFVTKFNKNLSQVIYSTTLGDTISNDEIIPNISPTAFLVNECENIFISGWGGETNEGFNDGFTANLPLTNNAFQKTTDSSDFYMMVVQKDLQQLLYATYFGGSESNEHVDGGTSRFDDKGIVYQSVCAGCGANNDFPIFPPIDNDPNTYPKPNNSANCNNGVIKFDLALLKAGLDTKVLCDNRVQFSNLSIGGINFEWDFGDGNDTITQTNIPVIHKYDNAGDYTVKLTARDITTCTAVDIASKVTIVPNQIGKVFVDSLCLGESVTLTPTFKPKATYKWTPTDFVNDSTASSVTITPTEPISYLVSIIDSFQCEQVDTINVFSLRRVKADLRVPEGCLSKNIEIKNITTDGASFNWIFGDGTIGTETDSVFFHNYPKDDLFYTIKLIANNPNTCNLSDSTQQTFYIPAPIISRRIEDSLCLGQEITVTPTIKEKASYKWFPTDFISNPTTSSITITPQKNIAYLVSITDSNQCLQVDTVLLEVKNYQPNINYKVLGSCFEFPNVQFNTGITNPVVEYTWQFEDGVTSFEALPTHVFGKYGEFTVQVSVTDGQCSASDSTELILEKLYVPNIITPNNDGKNDQFIINGIEDNGDWFLEIYNRWGEEIYHNESYNNSWTGDDLRDGTYYYLLTAPDETTCKGWIQITR